MKKLTRLFVAPVVVALACAAPAAAQVVFDAASTAATGTAVGATGTSLTPAVAVTNGGFDYVVDAVAYNNNVALTPGASQTNSYNVTHAAPNSSGAGSAKIGFANTTMTWTATGVA